MAKIIYFISPIDESKQKEIISKGTLRFALKELGIENDPLSVTINGMTPDDLDLETVLEDSDVVEVRRLVHGGGRAGNKSALATVVQIAAIVAVVASGGSLSPLAAAAITVGAAVVAGALNKWAADLLAAENATEEDEVSVNANSYSLTNASNQARPLKPIPVPIGSHRYAPDVYTDVWMRRYGGGGIPTLSNPYLSSFSYGLIATNGPEAASNSWATMPANWIGTNHPRYELKIAPYGFTSKTETLTSTENQNIIDQIKSEYSPPTYINYQFGKIGPDATYKSYPLIVYHSDPADPYYGRFNTWHAICRQLEATLAADKYGILGALFAGVPYSGSSTPWGNDNYIFHASTVANEANWLMKAFSGLTGYYIPSGMAPSNFVATNYEMYGNFLLAINNGSYSSTAKTSSYSAPIYLRDSTFSAGSIKEGIPYSTQLLNFGFGDLTLSDHKVGTIDVNSSSADTVGYSLVNKNNPIENLRWLVPNSNTLNWGQVEYQVDVLNHESKKLINPSFDIGIVSGYDLSSYNWAYFSGQVGLDSFSFAIAGRIYTTSSSGFSSNTTRFQIQYKWSGDPLWIDYNPPIITITNNNTNPLYVRYQLIVPIPLDKIDSEFIQVRIRKINLDSTDNENNKVSDLSISDISFMRTPSLAQFSGGNKNFAPMNILGLYTTALVSDAARTNKYSALVEAKCWVYDFDSETWSWAHTRNPAFWFLFFARGGFYNFESMADYPAPYSPTYGWQNYPNHPNNTSQIFGGGYSDDKIDMDKILQWAFFCEDQDLKIDGILKDEESVADTLEKIANVGRSSVSYYGGTLSVVFEDPEQVPVCMFGMGNIIADSFTVDYSVGDPVRKVIGTFVNRETWESETVEAIVPFSDPEVVKEIQITLLYITDKTEAQREVNILAARQFFQKRSYTFKVDWEGLLARRGDLAYLSHDSTQYGYSGRAAQFVVNSGVVIGIKTPSIIDSDVSYVSVRLPNGQLDTYTCEYEDGLIKFTEEYPIEKAPFYVNLSDENVDSLFNKSISEDFIFIADIKPTTGKKVRISSIEVDQDNVFTISAVDEDPAMWAYEYDDIESGESFDDSEVVLSVVNLRSLDLGQGKVRLLWDMQGGDFAQVINLNTGLPLEANGQYSFSEGDVVFELSSGIQYELEVRPMAIGTPYKSTPQRVKVWPM